jgi:hypothetical protein
MRPSSGIAHVRCMTVFRCQVACQVIHRPFEAALRQVEDTIRSRLQPWPRHQRGEEIADDGAATWHGLTPRIEDLVAISPTRIAFLDVRRQAEGGRRLGAGPGGRSVVTIFHHCRLRRLAVDVISLGQVTRQGFVKPNDDWREGLTPGNRRNLADLAAFHRDLRRRKRRHPRHSRRMAE